MHLFFLVLALNINLFLLVNIQSYKNNENFETIDLERMELLIRV